VREVLGLDPVQTELFQEETVAGEVNDDNEIPAEVAAASAH
jgi:hypothetical protein